MTDPAEDRPVLADLPPAPTAEDLRRIMRNQNWKTLLVAIPLILLGAGSIFFSSSGRDAAQDSYSATSVQLANNERNDCITKRRNAELDAFGQAVIAGLRAQKAGLLDDNEAEVDAQVQILDNAATARDLAAKSLTPDVINQPPPLGCGPPIVTVHDLQELSR